VHYRETIVWQKAVEMVREIYHLSPRLPETETNRWARRLRGQGFSSRECGSELDTGIT
jgi:hypothetical protein